jgi:hypothetical protein
MIDDETRKIYANIKDLGLWDHSIEILVGELSSDEQAAFYEASGESLLSGRRWYAENIGAFPRESKSTATPGANREGVKMRGEGSRCENPGCAGTMEFAVPKNCSCHISPPCRQCEELEPICNVCGYTEEEADAEAAIAAGEDNG